MNFRSGAVFRMTGHAHGRGGEDGMNQKQKKKGALLFFDIDGTLFDDRGVMPASMIQAMDEAHERGHRLIINTGRTLCNRDRRLDALPLDGWIMGCGTRVIYQGETLSSMELDPRRTMRLRNLMLEMEIPGVYECDTGLYFDPRGAAHPAITFFSGFARKQGIYREVQEDDPAFRGVKLFVFSDTREKIRQLEKRTGEMGMPFTGIDRGEGGYEMVPSGYSKGKGIEDLRRRLGAALEDCYAFGDSRNDLPMLTYAGHGIAMGNAPEDVQRVCEYVTGRPEEDGIRNAMIHYGLI